MNDVHILSNTCPGPASWGQEEVSIKALCSEQTCAWLNPLLPLPWNSWWYLTKNSVAILCSHLARRCLNLLRNAAPSRVSQEKRQGSQGGAQEFRKNPIEGPWVQVVMVGMLGPVLVLVPRIYRCPGAYDWQVLHSSLSSLFPNLGAFGSTSMPFDSDTV